MKLVKVCFLVSGNGGSLKFLVEAIATLGLKMEVVAVIGDRDCGALSYAEEVGIQTYQIQYSRKKPQALQALIQTLELDIIITNIHKIIDEETLGITSAQYINLHYSLLPAFAGLIGMDTIKAAKKANARFIGVSCHHVIAEVDAGLLIGQAMLPVNWNKADEGIIINTIFQSACLVLLNSLLLLNKDDEPKSNFLELNQQKCCFSPGLVFDLKELDGAFWQKIQNL